MTSKIFTFIIAALAVQGASAKVRTTRQIIGEASQAFRACAAGMKAAKSGNGALKVLRRDTQLSVVGQEDGSRRVVVANDDTFKPVLAYYDANGENPSLEWWLETMNRSLAKRLADGSLPYDAPRKAGLKESVAPMLTTAWGQDTPYSNLTPTYTSGSRELHYVTGCVATTMAQVLNFYKYPEKGKGYNKWTYYPNGDSGAGVSARVNFNTTYDWANMLDSYKGGYNDAQATAVATLMRDCGAACSMQYAAAGSGSSNYYALVGMRKNLRFDQASKNYMREFTPTPMWMDIIYTELSEGRPIMYSGATKDEEGHEFVLDGYDKDGLVHVEWGWDGNGNGYFDVDLLDSSEGSFSEGQQMLLVRKPGTTDYGYHSIWGLNSSLSITLSGSTINVGKATFYNLDVDNFTGQVQLLCFNVETNSGYLLSNISQLSDMACGSGGSLTLGKIDLAGIADGTYQLFFGSKSTEEGKVESGWMPIYGGDGVVDNYILTAAGGKLSLQKGNDDWSVPTGISHVAGGNSRHTAQRVFSIDGRSLGTDLNSLGKGLYIVNGKKIAK